MIKSKKTKSVNHNTQKLQVAKNDADWDEYLSTKSFQMQPATGAFKERLAIELVTWAEENTRAYKMSEFYHMKGILRNTFERWCRTHENLGHAYKLAMEILGNRREKGALEKKLEPGMVKHMMPLYDEDWAKREKDLAQLNEKSDRGPIKFDVYMDSYKVKKDNEGVE